MSKTEIILSLIILSIALYTAMDRPESQESFQTQVVSVTDGDTIDVRGEIDTTVRLLGVDTPETSSINQPSEFGIKDTLENRECLQKWGEKAKNYTEKRLNSTEITLELDPESDRRGDYKRLLAYVKLQNTSLNHELVSKGFARVYRSSFTKLESYKRLESEAREARKGLWKCVN